MKIILLSGKAGSGKNEVANILKEQLGNAVITGFSKYIKLFALEFTDWDGRDISKPRAFLQNMGDTLRNVDINFMTKRLVEDFEVYQTKYNYVIISDVRLPGEIEYIKNNSKYKVICVRVNASKSVRNLNELEKAHHTENDLDNYDKFDYIIENNFDETLKENIKSIVEGMI